MAASYPATAQAAVGCSQDPSWDDPPSAPPVDVCGKGEIGPRDFYALSWQIFKFMVCPASSSQRGNPDANRKVTDIGGPRIRARRQRSGAGRSLRQQLHIPQWRPKHAHDGRAGARRRPLSCHRCAMTSASSFHRNCRRQRGFLRPQRPIGRALGDTTRERGCQPSIHGAFTAGFIWFGPVQRAHERTHHR